MTSITNPGTLIDNSKRIAEPTYDPTDSDREEYDDEYKIPESHYTTD